MTKKQLQQAVENLEVQEEASQVTGYDPGHLSSIQTTAGRIRYLDSCGLKRGQIAKTLNIKYQWVRNVLITPVKTTR